MYTYSCMWLYNIDIAKVVLLIKDRNDVVSHKFVIQAVGERNEDLQKG